MVKKKATKKTKKKAAKVIRMEEEVEESFSPEMLDPQNIRERISISFRQDLLDEIRRQAKTRDIGYQTLIQSILAGIFLDQETSDLGERLNARLKIKKMQEDLEQLKNLLGR